MDRSKNSRILSRKKAVEILRKEFPYLASEFGVKKIGLFGSYAKGKPGQDSDVDIAVEFKKSPGLKFIEFAEYLEEALGKKADILTLEGIRGIRIKDVASSIARSISYV